MVSDHDEDGARSRALFLVIVMLMETNNVIKDELFLFRISYGLIYIF